LGAFATLSGGKAGPKSIFLQCSGKEKEMGRSAMRMTTGSILLALATSSALALWGNAAFAQLKPLQEDFSARRVVVPKTHTGPRITVQIDPVEQARRLAVTPKPDPVTEAVPVEVALAPITPSSSYGWYWDIVPTGLEAKDGRYDLAMASLSNGPSGARVPGPRLQHLQDVAAQYGIEILKATIGTDVSPALVLAVIGIESAGRADALSSAGAQGLMQLIPATAERFGVTDATDPAQNIKGGVSYLHWLMGKFDRDPLIVLAAYNAGEGAVAANKGVPPYAETRDYVPKVLAAWQVAQGLCQTPPELVTDPCVFKVISAQPKG
jgi:hypothetical protein